MNSVRPFEDRDETDVIGVWYRIPHVSEIREVPIHRVAITDIRFDDSTHSLTQAALTTTESSRSELTPTDEMR
jgi:hypothetical protein